MTHKDTLQKLLAGKIVAIIRGVAPDSILSTAQALLEGGVTLLEVTYDQSSEAAAEDTLRSLRLLDARFGGDICLGAGTVLTKAQVQNAVAAGARYIISPDTNPEIIRLSRQLDAVSIPGALTPSEAVQAHNAGADIVKLFPAGVLGADYIKAVCGPLGHLRYFAVGGVDQRNAAAFLRAGACGVGVGGSLVNLDWIREGAFGRITQCAGEYVRSLEGV